MDTTTRVQIPHEVVCILHNANPQGKGGYPIILHPHTHSYG